MPLYRSGPTSAGENVRAQLAARISRSVIYPKSLLWASLGPTGTAQEQKAPKTSSGIRNIELLPEAIAALTSQQAWPMISDTLEPILSVPFCKRTNRLSKTLKVLLISSSYSITPQTSDAKTFAALNSLQSAKQKLFFVLGIILSLKLIQ